MVDISNICKNSKEFVELLNRNQVLVTDATIFRVPESKYVRVAVATERENKKFIEILKKFSNI